MFYINLGNNGLVGTSGNSISCSGPNFCLNYSGPFDNLGGAYWYAQMYAQRTPDNRQYVAPNDIWVFSLATGEQTHGVANANKLYAWAVRDGDVAAAPIPASIWFFATSLMAFGALSIRRQKTKSSAQTNQIPPIKP